jgi:hypothetical protein
MIGRHQLGHICLTTATAAAAAEQESKYRDAIRYYQPLIARNANNLLGVTAIVLANLCVSYIMTSQVGVNAQSVMWIVSKAVRLLLSMPASHNMREVSGSLGSHIGHSVQPPRSAGIFRS